jgi:hypothetical protein
MVEMSKSQLTLQNDCVDKLYPRNKNSFFIFYSCDNQLVEYQSMCFLWLKILGCGGFKSELIVLSGNSLLRGGSVKHILADM